MAAGQLAGVLERRVHDGSYRSRLGLMSQIRDDFTEMAELLDHSRASPAQRGEREREFPQIDRIVLYVDDLDRCPPSRVVEVLEAIHLLLAVRLFVVVVAVDPRWLLQALTSHYRGLLRDSDERASSDEDELWRSTPLHYLEKIFQVPFTLAPLDTERYQRFVDDLLRPITATAPPPATPAADPSRQRPEPPVDVPAPRAAPPAAGGASRDVRPLAEWPLRLPAGQRSEQVDPLRLDASEQSFIRLLGPPLITSPRATKRLLNSYGLLLSLQGLAGRQAMLTVESGNDAPAFRAALTLLATVIARPDASPDFFRHLHGAPAGKSWLQFLEEEEVRLGETDLVDALRTLTERAASAQQPLPAVVEGYRPWVVRAGRLSFQTGREVVRLGPPAA